MDRFQPVSLTTSSLGAHLTPAEEVVTLCASVGLYSGPTKSLPHSSGTVYLTSHRLFYIDDKDPHRHSGHLDLDLIKNSEYYAGFLKSSPKVTLGLRTVEPPLSNASSSRSQSGSRNNNSSPLRATTPARQDSASPIPSPKKSTSSSVPTSQQQDWRLNATVQDLGCTPLPKTSWVCRVCAFNNAMEQTRGPGVVLICKLCGVSQDPSEVMKAASAIPDASPGPKDRSALRTGADAVTPTSMGVTSSDSGVLCPVCTFGNHPSMVRCEMCDTPLGSIDVNAMQGTTRQLENGRNRPNGFYPVVSLDDALAGSGGEENGIDDEGDDYGTSLPVEKHDSVRLSFRKGGDKAFYGLLKTTLQRKAWKAAPKDTVTIMSGAYRNIDGRDPGAASGTVLASTSRRVGIEGIFSTMEMQSREDNQGMQDALKDLEALMSQAKRMVDFAESLNAKLSRQEAMRNAQGPNERGEGYVGKDEEAAATLIRSSLLRLGLPTPALTPDMARDEAEYHRGLARELGGLLYDSSENNFAKRPNDQGKGLMGRGRVLVRPDSTSLPGAKDVHETERGGRGIVALDEAWCVWNRARGVALLPPSTLLTVASSHLNQWTSPPISMRTFRSGLRVLVTPQFDDARFLGRVLGDLRRRHDAQAGTGSMSTMEIARSEGAPLALIQEMLEAVEVGLGQLVRDDGSNDSSSNASAGTTMWYADEISAFDWDAWVQCRDT